MAAAERGSHRQREVPLIQEYLAQMLGIRRTSVTLLAHEMQVSGLMKYKRGHIKIRKGIEECACECYDVMRTRGRMTLA